ncbi:hypothetical protein, partial [Leisingera sp. JC1]|uniref:hypothetical protein n=1 Tax=Leisingera sp. JC1 TaxID=1855282 RepID=UPI001130828D
MGRINDAGNPVMLAGGQHTLAIFAKGGNLGYAPGSTTEYDLGAAQEHEPSWLSVGSGHNLFANYVDGTGLYVNGDAQPQGTAASFTYGGSGLAWGGRIGATNRYSNGAHTGAFAWDTAPSGTDLAAVHA